LVGLPPLLCVVGGREPVEGGVGPVGIVLYCTWQSAI
jgi:hypothetical protein